jgi:hypothetical protein
MRHLFDIQETIPPNMRMARITLFCRVGSGRLGRAPEQRPRSLGDDGVPIAALFDI